VIRDLLLRAAAKPRRMAAEQLGPRLYWGLMRHADALLGNSSSALVEAPILGLPAVNIGDRQRGRLRGRNVVDAVGDVDAVALALASVVSPAFRQALAPESLFGDGHAAARVADILASWRVPHPPVKTFHEAGVAHA
jgi:UDP-N-acetylglucosamine 2-epimerase (non-hydrolysing)/GDP/UDP-N,N'-diacetylbacillosamine 2-epimerase (hydrolysing)